MTQQQIDPAKVTKPIQLLAAWLAGLILTNGSFLAAASSISRPDWAAGLLIIAAIANVPVFLFCLFLLQTRFRPEMQEDQYYASYLERRYSAETAQTELVEIAKDIRVGPPIENTASAGRDIIFHHRTGSVRTYAETRIQINELLPKYAEIKEALAHAGIVISSTFGPNSKPGGVPALFIVTFGEGADIATFKKIVGICRKFGLDGISYSENSVSRNDIYIGGYGYKYYPYIPIESEVLRSNDFEAISAGELIQIITGPRAKTYAEPTRLP